MSPTKIRELVACAAIGAIMAGCASLAAAAPPPAHAPAPKAAPSVAPPALPAPPVELPEEQAPTPPGLVTVPTITLTPLPDPIPITSEPAGPPVTMTVDQVIAAVIASNPTVMLSKQRIDAIADAMGEITAQKNLQLRVQAGDTLTSYKTFAPSLISITPVNVQSGQIPTVVDAAQGGLFTAGSAGSGGTSGISAGQTNNAVGSSTTSSPTGTLTIVPVTAPPGSTSTDTTPTGTGSSGSTSGNAPVGGGGTAQPHTIKLQPLATTSTGGGIGGGNYNNFGATASVSKLLDVFGLVGQSESIQRSNVDFYRMDLDRTINELALTTKNVFFSVLRAQANVAAAQQQVDDANATVHDTTIKFNAGAVAHYDVISAQSQLINAEQALVAARNNLRVQSQTLNNLMHLPIDTNVTLTSPPLPALPASYDAATEVGRAYANRPEVKQAALGVDIAGRIVHLQSEGLMPTFGLGLTGNVAGPSSGQRNGGISGPVDLALTAGVSWPLLDGGANKSRVQVAKDNLKSQQITLDQLHQNVDLEVRSALADVVDAAVLLNADQQGVVVATEALRLARVRYQAGSGTLLEVTNAEATLAATKFNLASAQFQLQTAAASLLRAEGGR